MFFLSEDVKPCSAPQSVLRHSICGQCIAKLVRNFIETCLNGSSEKPFIRIISKSDPYTEL